MQRSLQDLIQSVLPPSSNWKIFLLQEWPHIMGNLKEQVRLEKIQDDNSLVLAISNTTWMQELYFLADMLLEKINKTLEYPHVKQLRFKYSPRQTKTQVVKDEGGREQTSFFKLKPREQEALNCINDSQLRQALESFLKRCRFQEDNEKSMHRPARLHYRT